LSHFGTRASSSGFSHVQPAGSAPDSCAAAKENAETRNVATAVEMRFSTASTTLVVEPSVLRPRKERRESRQRLERLTFWIVLLTFFAALAAAIEPFFFH
jgi:hypothetical protein